jgi:group I intron endonuclease
LTCIFPGWGELSYFPLKFKNINNIASQFIEQMNQAGIIYCLHCISTGKKYIGQTSRNLKTRLRHHNYKLKSSETTRSKLYHQLKKTGWEDFVVGIVENCVLDDLDKMEIFYIEKYNTLNDGLNTAHGGGFFPVFRGEEHPLYGKGHTEKTKEKIRQNHHDVSGENNPMYGKKFTPEHKEKIRKAHLENDCISNTFWWNNGETEVRSKIHPGENYIKGRLPGVNKSRPSAHKNTSWWNNGEIEMRSLICPGENFIKGRKLNSKKVN